MKKKMAALVASIIMFSGVSVNAVEKVESKVDNTIVDSIESSLPEGCVYDIKSAKEYMEKNKEFFNLTQGDFRLIKETIFEDHKLEYRFQYCIDDTKLTGPEIILIVDNTTKVLEVKNTDYYANINTEELFKVSEVDAVRMSEKLFSDKLKGNKLLPYKVVMPNGKVRIFYTHDVSKTIKKDENGVWICIYEIDYSSDPYMANTYRVNYTCIIDSTGKILEDGELNYIQRKL